LKRPAIIILLNDVGKLRISVAGERARLPGSLNVATNEPYGYLAGSAASAATAPLMRARASRRWLLSCPSSAASPLIRPASLPTMVA
jgi:hypothetical protein